MVHHNNSHVTSAAEVSIFSAKEIVGALRNIIVHEIPCLEKSGRGFLFISSIKIIS